MFSKHHSKNVNPKALATLTPTITHPVTMTCLFVNTAPVSHIKCLIPFQQWYVNGMLTSVFRNTCAANGIVAKLAASVALSRCQPRVGEARYASPKR